MCEECDRLQAENTSLRDQIKRAKNVINRQKKQLDDVRGLAWKILKATEKAMLNHLPRGTWSLWRGRGETAYLIFSIVFVNWASMVEDILQ